MARIEATYVGQDFGGDQRSDARVSDLARRSFDAYDRSIFAPLPRPTFRGAPRRSRDRKYDRYFPRSAKR